MALRIIAGRYGGRKLEAPKGDNTRPTRERVREAVMSMIQLHFAGARVLEVCAGSGIWSLEAISRGAASAVMVDKDRQAAAVMQKNIATLGLEEACQVICADGLEALNSACGPFELVFCDPPYSGAPAFLAALCERLAAKKLLSPGAMLVFEQDAADEHSLPDGFECIKERAYGRSLVMILRCKA